MDSTSKILVTGANGLLGSYILRYLVHQGYNNLTALVRNKKKLELIPSSVQSTIQIVEGDILDFNLINNLTAQMDYVVHTAAEVHFSNRKLKQLFKTNVDGTANIANCCLANNVKKLVYISSTAALGRLYQNQKIDENEMWEKSDLNTPYAISKHYGELEVWRAHEEGLNIAILNPSLIISPGYFNKSSAGIYTRIFDSLNHYPTGTNGVVDVRDVARMTIKSLELNQDQLKIIVCAKNIKYQDLFEKIALEFKKKIPSKPIQKYQRILLQILFKIKSIFGKKVDISKASLLNSSMDFYYNNQLSKDIFKYKYIPINKTISDACIAFSEAKKTGETHCVLELIH